MSCPVCSKVSPHVVVIFLPSDSPSVLTSNYRTNAMNGRTYLLHMQAFVLIIKFISASLTSDVGYKVVSSKQQALECDQCKSWIHRLCGTGLSQGAYRDMMRQLRHGEAVEWICQMCVSSSHVGKPLLESTRVDALFT